MVHFKLSHASFRGKNNLTKTWALLTLKVNRDDGDNAGLDAYDLAVLSRRPLTSIKTRVRFWTKWGYISRRLGRNRYGRAVNVFRLAPRGQEFIETRVPSGLRESIERQLLADKNLKHSQQLTKIELTGPVTEVLKTDVGRWVKDSTGHYHFVKGGTP